MNQLEINFSSLPKEKRIQMREIARKIDAEPMKKHYQLYIRIARKNQAHLHFLAQKNLQRKIEGLPMKKDFQLKARLSKKSYQFVKNEHLKPKLEPINLEPEIREIEDSPLESSPDLKEIKEKSEHAEMVEKQFSLFFNGIQAQNAKMSLSQWKKCPWRTWTHEDFIPWFFELEDYVEERKENLDVPSPLEYKGLSGSTKRKLVNEFELAMEPKKCRKSLFA